MVESKPVAGEIYAFGYRGFSTLTQFSEFSDSQHSNEGNKKINSFLNLVVHQS